MPAELAKRVICACTREMFLQRFYGVQKSKNFLGHFSLSIFIKDNFPVKGANIISDLSFEFSIMAELEELTLVHDLLILSTNCRK